MRGMIARVMDLTATTLGLLPLISVRYNRTWHGTTVHGVTRIRTIRHRGLRRFVEADDAREIRSDLANRVRRILTALISAADMDGVQGPPGWRVHQPTGDRAGTWSVPASGNWRITFALQDGEICTPNLEDYH